MNSNTRTLLRKMDKTQKPGSFSTHVQGSWEMDRTGLVAQMRITEMLRTLRGVVFLLFNVFELIRCLCHWYRLGGDSGGCWLGQFWVIRCSWNNTSVLRPSCNCYNKNNANNNYKTEYKLICLRNRGALCARRNGFDYGLNAKIVDFCWWILI